MPRAINRTLHLVLVFSVLLGSLVGSLSPGSAAGQVEHPLDETLLLLAGAELWATGGGEPVAASGRSPGLSAPAAPRAGSARQIQVSINAVKEVIAVKQAAYEQSTAMLEGNVSEATLQAHEEKHLLEMNQLNGALEELRKEWRRQKRFFPKLVKPFKQAGGWFWHQIGPAGRQILRAVGDDLIQIVVAGDPISGRVIKMLILKHARTLGREKAKEWLVRLALRDRSGPAEEEPATAGSGGEGEEGEELTFDEFWATVYADLQSQRLHCNEELVRYYRECLERNVEAVEDEQSLLESCDSFLRNMRSFPERATLEDTAFRHRDDDNTFTLTYDVESGEVSGRYEVVFVDVGYGSTPEEVQINSCTVSMVYDFTGRISAADCTLTGSGVRTVEHEGGDRCAWMESEVGTTQQPFQATIDRGVINGGAGGLAFMLDVVEHAK
jgi:hypothetical protein